MHHGQTVQIDSKQAFKIVYTCNDIVNDDDNNLDLNFIYFFNLKKNGQWLLLFGAAWWLNNIFISLAISSLHTTFIGSQLMICTK